VATELDPEVWSKRRHIHSLWHRSVFVNGLWEPDKFWTVCGQHFSGQEYELRINDWSITPQPLNRLTRTCPAFRVLPDCASRLKISYVKDKTKQTDESERCCVLRIFHSWNILIVEYFIQYIPASHPYTRGSSVSIHKKACITGTVKLGVYLTTISVSRLALVSDIKGGTQTESVWEQGLEENIWTEEWWSNRILEKTA
jgi:hypothetical protein